MSESLNGQEEPVEEVSIDPMIGSEVLRLKDSSIVLPDHPWLPTHGGVEIRVVSNDEKLNLNEGFGKEEDPTEQLLKMGKIAVTSSEVAKSFSEADNPEDPDWYDKPWFNLNFNSQLGREKFTHFNGQVLIRPRTLGQTRTIKSNDQNAELGDNWSNPYWTIPVPVNIPLNEDDRAPYDQELREKVTGRVKGNLSQQNVDDIILFKNEQSEQDEDHSFEFRISKNNFPVWQMGDYLLVTQNNPLVDRKDGLHLVLIYRGEQEDESKRYVYPWRDNKKIAEMAIISFAVSKIISEYGYAGNKFDKSYIHFNANWSLGHALPEERRDDIMDFGSDVSGKWPGPINEQNVPGPNVHPHIQLLKVDDMDGNHDLDIAFSGTLHKRKTKTRQTDQEIVEIKELLSDKLTPLIDSLRGQKIENNYSGENL